MAITLATGESLNGDGNELAHIDLLIGSKSGPVGEAFANAFVNERAGHTNLLAVVTPNLAAKPDTVISNKVTIKGEKQAVQLFGPAQAAVALHHRRRVHPLGGRGRQEDLRLQLRGGEGVDLACAQGRAEHRQGPRRHSRRASPVRRRRRGLRLPAASH